MEHEEKFQESLQNIKGIGERRKDENKVLITQQMEEERDFKGNWEQRPDATFQDTFPNLPIYCTLLQVLDACTHSLAG